MGIEQHIAIPTDTAAAPAVFPEEQRAHFATNYPETPHLLHHRLGENPILYSIWKPWRRWPGACPTARSSTTAATCRSGSMASPRQAA